MSTPFNRASYPLATTTYYQFPARGSKPAVKLTWYDGDITPATPDEMGDERLNEEGGILFIGSTGKMTQQTYGINPRLWPRSRHEAAPAPPQLLPRIPGSMNGHEMNWLESIQGRQTPSSPISFAAPLTEVMLLGIAALRAGTKIHYDAANMRITNTPPPDGPNYNDFLTREYRTGW